MADPLTALQLAFTAVRAGAAIGEWWDNHQAKKSSPASSDGLAAFNRYRQSINEVHYTLAVLGQHLLRLGVVNHSALPEARKAVREALATGDQDDDQGEEFDKMGDMVQYAMTCAMVFCAECWPMCMWQGFGCGVTNNMLFADLSGSDVIAKEMDKSIVALKSKVHEWQLLTKSPSRISHTEPIIEAYPKEIKKETTKAMKDIIGEMEKRGFPQPKPPNDHVKILRWYIPFATWAGSSMYVDCGHDCELFCSYQLDPGRLLYSWVVGGRAQLRPGEAIFLPIEHVQYLAKWLEGLNGMNFRVFSEGELDFSKIKPKKSTRKLLEWDNQDDGDIGDPCVMVGLPPRPQQPPGYQNQSPQVVAFPTPDRYPPPPAALAQSYPTPPQSYATPPQSHAERTQPYAAPVQPYTAPPPSYSLPVYSYAVPPAFPPTQASFVPENALSTMKRRPVPLPPVPAIKVAIAAYTFSPITKEELGFNAGDRLEILDDTAEDGWWRARLGGAIGLVPSTFMQ